VIPRRWLLLLRYNRTKTEIGAGIVSERESAVVIETGMRTVAMLREIQKETGTDTEREIGAGRGRGRGRERERGIRRGTWIGGFEATRTETETEKEETTEGSETEARETTTGTEKGSGRRRERGERKGGPTAETRDTRVNLPDISYLCMQRALATTTARARFRPRPPKTYQASNG
jgi:hypothetical protein